MSSFTRTRTVTKPLVYYIPTAVCGNWCKTAWSERRTCEHGISPSPDCSERCRVSLSVCELCIHAKLYCTLCSEMRWPVHSCYCHPNILHKRPGWVQITFTIFSKEFVIWKSASNRIKIDITFIITYVCIHAEVEILKRNSILEFFSIAVIRHRTKLQLEFLGNLKFSSHLRWTVIILIHKHFIWITLLMTSCSLAFDFIFQCHMISFKK